MFDKEKLTQKKPTKAPNSPASGEITAARFPEGKDRLVVKTADRGRVVVTAKMLKEGKYYLTVQPNGAKYVTEG